MTILRASCTDVPTGSVERGFCIAKLRTGVMRGQDTEVQPIKISTR